MKSLVILIYLALFTVIISCSGALTSIKTSTPEEFGSTLFNIVKSKDSVAFQNLIATNVDLVKFVEASEEYKSASAEKKALILALLGVAFENSDGEKNMNNSISWIYNKSKRLEIESWDNAQIIEIKKGKTDEENVFWINTFIEIAGKQYCIRCQEVMLIPEKGFRLGPKELKFYESDPITSK